MKSDKRLDNLHKNKRRKHKGDLIQCTKCKEFKPKENFGKNKFKWDRLTLWCKKCSEKYRKKPKQNNTMVIGDFK